MVQCSSSWRSESQCSSFRRSVSLQRDLWYSLVWQWSPRASGHNASCASPGQLATSRSRRGWRPLGGWPRPSWWMRRLPPSEPTTTCTLLKYIIFKNLKKPLREYIWPFTTYRRLFTPFLINHSHDWCRKQIMINLDRYLYVAYQVDQVQNMRLSFPIWCSVSKHQSSNQAYDPPALMERVRESNPPEVHTLQARSQVSQLGLAAEMFFFFGLILK